MSIAFTVGLGLAIFGEGLIVQLGAIIMIFSTGFLFGSLNLSFLFEKGDKKDDKL